VSRRWRGHCRRHLCNSAYRNNRTRAVVTKILENVTKPHRFIIYLKIVVFYRYHFIPVFSFWIYFYDVLNQRPIVFYFCSHRDYRHSPFIHIRWCFFHKRGQILSFCIFIFLLPPTMTSRNGDLPAENAMLCITSQVYLSLIFYTIPIGYFSFSAFVNPLFTPI